MKYNLCFSNGTYATEIDKYGGNSFITDNKNEADKYSLKIMRSITKNFYNNPNFRKDLKPITIKNVN